MVLKRPLDLNKLIPKKNQPRLSGGAGNGGKFHAPESNLPEFEHVDPSTLPEFQRPSDSYGGFYIDERAAADARADSLRRFLEYVDNIKRGRKQRARQRFFTEDPEATRRGYQQLRPYANQFKQRGRRDPKTPVLVFPRTPVATQPSPEQPNPPETTPEEPGFGVPEDPPVVPPKDREKEFKTCQELEEEIRAITGLEISFCTQRGASKNLQLFGTTDGQTSGNTPRSLLQSKSKVSRRKGWR